MEREYFGTDGIRGTANTWPMTAEIAVRAGMAAGLQFTRGDYRHRVVVGKDTRLSGYMFEPALTAGFTSVGMDVILVGPMPTPAVAMLTQSLRADLGVMLSASHNAYADNGIKFFGPDGHKLSDRIETEIEKRMQSDMTTHLAQAASLGRAKRLDDAPGRYIEAAKATFPSERRLDGLKVVVDCANGAAYKVAPTVLFELEADVIELGVDPDGFNINQECGSTHPEYLCEQVVAHGANVGIALDGDADRLVLADENGRVVDGDQLIAAISDHWAKTGTLKGGGIVATVMSNLGLERHLASKGLELVRTQVGDRYVVEHMRQHGFNVGGEQSGHIVMSDFSTSGDGLVAALQVLGLVVAEDRAVSEVCRRFEAVPQLLKNVQYSGPSPLETQHISLAIQAQRNRLGPEGRLLIRPSGTEPLIRVMAEGDDQELVTSVVNELVEMIDAMAGN